MDSIYSVFVATLGDVKNMLGEDRHDPVIVEVDPDQEA